mmetsp:Transcript_23081/g.36789  ORF Transcript_23081/g.36789 Transcript_23081/m.36789 type:complete len:119 (+) Transcript_23081:990-1346(+)
MRCVQTGCREPDPIPSPTRRTVAIRDVALRWGSRGDASQKRANKVNMARTDTHFHHNRLVSFKKMKGSESGNSQIEHCATPMTMLLRCCGSSSRQPTVVQWFGRAVGERLQQKGPGGR